MMEKGWENFGEIQSDKLLQTRKLEHSVENRTSFAVNGSELNIYETYHEAEKVALRFDNPVLTSMVTGKKIMHFPGEEHFSFLPGESLIVPSGKPMLIDFPLANENTPTKCLALVLEKPLISSTLTYFNEKVMGADGMEEWSISEQNYHLLNDRAITSLLNHLILLYTESNRTKDLFIDLSLKELIIRLAQSQARSVLVGQAAKHENSHRLSKVVLYVKNNLEETLTVDKLSDVACLSKSHFFKMFHNHFGITPNQFVLQERMKLAASLLKQPEIMVSEVADRSGFSDVSYFCKVFKKWYQVTPVEFRTEKESSK